MNKAYLLIGGNLGDRMEAIRLTKDLIQQHCGEIFIQSAIYETAAWGIEDQPSFCNMALGIQTKLSPNELLHNLLQIEIELGRKRFEKYGPRIMDIDILFFNHEILDSPELVIPHPSMQVRRFALVPLNEIAPEYFHPVFQKTVFEILMGCPDMLNVQKI